jgi:SAM-dependent methyltransferase
VFDATYQRRERTRIDKKVKDVLDSGYFPIERKRFLDIGCNYGLFSQGLLDRGAAHVVGIDLHRSVVCPELLSREDFEFVEGDVTQVLPDVVAGNVFDTTLCLAVLHHVLGRYGMDTMSNVLSNAFASAPLLVLEFPVKEEQTDAGWMTALRDTLTGLFCPSGDGDGVRAGRPAPESEFESIDARAIATMHERATDGGFKSMFEFICVCASAIKVAETSIHGAIRPILLIDRDKMLGFFQDMLGHCSHSE